jgi:uncharacterized membrane protein (DUF106 family)
MVFGLSPAVFIVSLSAILSLAISLVYKFATDQVLMRELKKELKSMQQKMKENKDNPDKVKEINSKLMQTNMKYMKQSFKPMLITMIPFLLIFSLLRDTYAGVIVIPLPFTLPWIGNYLGWLGTYFVSSVIFTTVFRKLLKVV